MAEIRHEFAFRVSPERLYEALTKKDHVSGWWTSECDIQPVVGSLARFAWKTHGWVIVMRIVKLVPGKTIEWECVESNMQDTAAWIKTAVHFDIAPAGEDQSVLVFRQNGYGQSVCYEVCHEGWAFVLGTSLKNYLELGAGRPYRAEAHV